MTEVDFPAIVSAASPWLLAMAVLTALIRGELVPRKTHEAMIAKRDETIREVTTDRDYYREQTLALLRVADVAADRMTQALLHRPAQPQRERGDQ